MNKKITNNQSKNLQSSLESSLFEITECAVKTQTIEEYAEELHHIIKRLMYAENFFIAMYDNNKSVVDFVYIVDESDSEIHLVIDKLSKDELNQTLTGYMLKQATTQHLNSQDQQALIDQGDIANVGHDSVDWLGVPLIYNKEVLGGMVVQSYQKNIVYSKKEEKIMQFVARQIALVIKSKQAEHALKASNLELESHVQKRTQELKKINSELAIEISERKKSEAIQYALFKITELVNTSYTLGDFFASVHKVVSQLMSAKNEYVALLSEDKTTIDFVYFVDESEVEKTPRKFNQQNKKQGLTERILISGEALLYNRDPQDPDSFDGTNCTSYLGVPLINEDHVFGVLAVQSYHEELLYNEKDKAVLTTIGQQVATAILRKKDADSLLKAHELLEKRVRERTSELEKTIEKRKRIEDKLAHESLHDALTGLPNRLHLSKQLDLTIGQTEKSKKNLMALLFLDLDRFKIINDSLGHHVGDLFLIEVAVRLKKCLRADDMVARLGGDEFCVLMPDIPKETVALQLASRILKELKKPVMVAQNSLMTSASIGVRIAQTSETSAETILGDADAAMYQAKHQGKNRFCFFDAKIKELVSGRMKMERDLRDAVDAGELFLVYQPLVDFQQNKVVGFEALVRWNHPQDGLINPAVFIPVAEETGIIVEIGEAVIEMACKALARFKSSPLTSDLYLNVNVSSVQILSRTLDEFIRKSLRDNNLEPEKLNIEITESILIDDYKAALSFVRELKAMNIKIYLDDFGTGFSSLSYLHKFPFDAIKLDRSFIVALDESKNNEAIVDSIAQLARNLNIHIVAEGIETKRQLEVIAAMDYQVAQGYYFSKPIEAEQIESYISDYNL
jgi:diguanylate cyclase (GGDEF)-like protein